MHYKVVRPSLLDPPSSLSVRLTRALSLAGRRGSTSGSDSADCAKLAAEWEAEAFEERVKLVKLRENWDSITSRRQLIKADLKAALKEQHSVLAAAFEQQHGMPALVVSGVQRSGQSWIMPALGPEAATKMPPHFPYIQLPALLE